MNKTTWDVVAVNSDPGGSIAEKAKQMTKKEGVTWAMQVMTQ
jgi:hypothetical protein